MSYKKFFHQTLRQQYPADHPQLCEAIETRYHAIFPDVAFALKVFVESTAEVRIFNWRVRCE